MKLGVRNVEKKKEIFSHFKVTFEYHLNNNTESNITPLGVLFSV